MTIDATIQTRARPVSAGAVLLAIGVMLSGVSPAGAAEFSASVTDAAGTALADAVVLLEPVGAAPGAQAPVPVVVEPRMDQVDETFVPHVLAVPRGASVRFANSDRTRHHVYAFSPQQTFDVTLDAQSEGKTVPFDQPGVVPLGCNIHDHMLAFVVVSESPWFGRTDAEGRTMIADVPDGAYTARVWFAGARPGWADPVPVTITGDSVALTLTAAGYVPARPPTRRGFDVQPY